MKAPQSLLGQVEVLSVVLGDIVPHSGQRSGVARRS